MRSQTASVVAIVVAVVLGAMKMDGAPARKQILRLDSATGFEVLGGVLQPVTYRGRKAVQLKTVAGHEHDDVEVLALLSGSDFREGTIELDLAGAPHADSGPGAKGFIGLAFRAEGEAAEIVYLRPSNARSDDQLVRNHSIQYVSHPEFTWQKLRKETPGVYESYVDLEPGVWTHMKVVISATKARVYVNGASQPCLVVNDLKRGAIGGKIGLWTHATTEAYFSNLIVQ